MVHIKGKAKISKMSNTFTLRRDIVVEFSGMPKSGKTTTLDIVAHYLKRSGVPVSEFHGGGRYAPLGKSDQGKLNLYLACEAVRRVVTVGATPGAHPRLYLLDRGLLDRYIFTCALKNLGRLTDAHHTAIASFFSAPELERQIDLAFVFTTSSTISLARENKNSLTTDSGRVMNTTMLDALREAALETLRPKPPTYVKAICHIDTTATDGDVRNTARTVLMEMMKLDELSSLELPA